MKTLLPTEVRFETILRTSADQADVRREVKANFWDNRWWPERIADWRLRMIIAALSTRLSYAHIKSYSAVVAALESLGYETLRTIDDDALRTLLAPIGLYRLRVGLVRSLIGVIEQRGGELLTVPASTAIAHIAREVYGASYKVAQCCVLYSRGYHCGVMPVDSGMRDMLGPCIGLPLPKGAEAHEVMRTQLERLTAQADCSSLATETGYPECKVGDAPGIAAWWAHLVLVYFKRLYCNRKRPAECPLRGRLQGLGAGCDPCDASAGGYRKLIVEGIDGAGKTTLIERLVRLGYDVIVNNYDPIHDPKAKYLTMISDGQRAILDRSFISEYVYGSVIRGRSRLARPDLEELFTACREAEVAIIFIDAADDVLRSRRRDTEDAHAVLGQAPQLRAAYEECLSLAEDVIPVIRMRSDDGHSPAQLVAALLDIA